MTKVTLSVATLGAGEGNPLTGDDLRDIRTAFLAASNGAIALEPSIRPPIDQALRSEVAAFDLHSLSGRLTGNPQTAGRVRHISLILAPRYKPRPDVFGVMFDRGFATRDDPNSSPPERAAPREGCAVFLDAIRDLKTDPGEAARQMRFTAIHELGHIFNLVHEAGAHYMAGSFDGPKAPLKHVWKFSQSQKEWLQRADTDPMVWPGGAAFQDKHDIMAADIPDASRPSLAISLSRTSLARGMPVELDIRLEIDGAGKALIPNEIDPGYARFQIWIEDPDGERRRYRPLNRYCAPAAPIEVKAAAPFERDLSVYAQSGGFTFSKPGVHRVWARLLMPGGREVVSPVVSLEVRPPVFASRTDSDMLKARKIQSLLFYRETRRLRDAVDLDVQVVDVVDRQLRAQLRYALARALEKRQQRSPANRKRLGELVRRQAALACDRPEYLGRRQLHHASRLMGGT